MEKTRLMGKIKELTKEVETINKKCENLETSYEEK